MLTYWWQKALETITYRNVMFLSYSWEYLFSNVRNVLITLLTLVCQCLGNFGKCLEQDDILLVYWLYRAHKSGSWSPGFSPKAFQLPKNKEERKQVVETFGKMFIVTIWTYFQDPWHSVPQAICPSFLQVLCTSTTNHQE